MAFCCLVREKWPRLILYISWPRPGISHSDFTFTFRFHALEKEMATHSSVLAWRIPGTGKPGGLPSLGSHRIGHDWSDLAAAAAATELWFLLMGHSQFLQNRIMNENLSWECLNPCWYLLLPWHTLSTRTRLSIDCKKVFFLWFVVSSALIFNAYYEYSLWWWQCDLLLNLQGLEQILRQARVPINFYCMNSFVNSQMIFPSPSFLNQDYFFYFSLWFISLLISGTWHTGTYRYAINTAE